MDRSITPACAGATDIATERGDEGVTKIKELTGKVFDLTLPLELVAEGYRAMHERRASRCC